jgi:prepilin-type N-terminal cleavage/methylation domain-containing protein
MTHGKTIRAFSLIEIILALVILAVCSVAVCTLTFGAMNDDRYLRKTAAYQAEAELAIRRVTNNIRSAQAGTIVLGTTNILTTVTQADSAGGYPNGVTVTYTLQNDPGNSGKKQLCETDARYGTNNVLASNVTSFTVTAVSGVADLYNVDIVIAGTPPIERHVQVYCRN